MAGPLDLKKLYSIMQRTPQEKNYPKHVVINLFPIKTTEEKKKDDFKKILSVLNEIADVQIEKNIPIMTVSLGKKNDIDQNVLYKYTKEFLKKAIEHKINVTIFGRWYDLEGQLVEELKKLNNDTNDFDHFFLNLCINYDAHQEIADTSRVIIRKILMEKTDIDGITPELIKENLYSSYFIPVDLVIEPSEKFSATFLWDSTDAIIYNINKPVLSISKSDVIKLIDKYAQGSS